MAELTNEEIGAEALAIANEIQAVLAGRSTVAALLVIGMVLGYAASLGTKPCLDELMAQIRSTAADEMRRCMS